MMIDITVMIVSLMGKMITQMRMKIKRKTPSNENAHKTTQNTVFSDWST